MTEKERIEKAIKLAVQYGGIDGDHHKSWAIDQMVRALTGCPTVSKEAIDSAGTSYSYDAQGESDEYAELVASAKDGEDGPDTYDWDCGIAP